ncbi:GNAT family N-acetyltransferase [Cryobacterium adonitolivorans]|uniref:GNAT family N-acetyltransferase n=1 Tax=Cryobacterium adonitolivorans TaxID=1259189 RepID=A0A4R8VZS6_9MICO|nr:GNAT family N-acetyltransferase [Cryobacterium adonitolivorans]TFB99601.1 GNAT family N-acetyltransferase [Cryobacterium adonitolivorans]
MSAEYEIRRFEPAAPGESGYPEATAWDNAVTFGFHEERRTDERVRESIAMSREDGAVFTGAYQTGQPAPHSLASEIPVATFGSRPSTLNIGFGRLLDAHLITGVTVRTSHRRRGLLRRMMTEDLALAQGKGIAIAALTASEASIYGRFGFGVATSEQSITVDTSAKFQLDHLPVGTVEVADPKVLLELAPQVFARLHGEQPGSIGRQEFYRQLAAGATSREGGPDSKVKVALHYAPDGTVDGYVSYRFGGWDKTPATMEIVDLVAATPAAYLELWQYLAAIDLVERITWNESPVDNPLTWALTDPRCVAASNPRDMLWLRILDVRQALETRHFAADGTVVLRVTDGLGLTAGTFSLEVRDGAARVTASAAAPDLELDIAALSSIYLGAVNPVSLAAANRVHEHTPGAAFLAARLFAVERPAHCLTHF